MALNLRDVPDLYFCIISPIETETVPLNCVDWLYGRGEAGDMGFRFPPEISLSPASPLPVKIILIILFAIFPIQRIIASTNNPCKNLIFTDTVVIVIDLPDFHILHTWYGVEFA
jgi:hypothetical protein